MRTCIVVRCQNGIVVWVRQIKSFGTFVWHCVNDGFEVTAPLESADMVTCLQGMAAHSAQVGGALLQVVQLDL